MDLWHLLNSFSVTLGSCACKVPSGTIRLGSGKRQSRGEMDRTRVRSSYPTLHKQNYSAFLLSVCSGLQQHLLQMMWLLFRWEKNMHLAPTMVMDISFQDSLYCRFPGNYITATPHETAWLVSGHT